MAAHLPCSATPYRCMATIPYPSLFSWQSIEAASDLDRLRLVLAAMSTVDEPFMRQLEIERGRGRDDYPIRACWNALLAGIVYQHQSSASLLRELRRNAELRQECGFDPLRGAVAVPSDDAFGNFLLKVIEHYPMLMEMFHALVAKLGAALPDLGTYTACDSKAISSFGGPTKKAGQKRADGQADQRRDNDADWGMKTYRGVREDGTVWEKVTKWFGYKLHLVVDSVYEMPLAFALTRASASDCTNLLPLVEDMTQHHPELKGRVQEMAGDKGYDSGANNATLYDKHGIKPVIDTRRLWKDGEKTKAVDPDASDVFVYDEQGQVYCLDPMRGEQRTMCFDGFEPGRDTLKYRCPAAALGCTCHGRAECEALSARTVGAYGRVLRIPLKKDRRIFTPIARHSRTWDTAYDRRTSVERVNSRLDRVLGFEQHTIRGMAKMQARVTLALVVMLAMALGRIQAGQKEQMRSLTAPVRRAA